MLINVIRITRRALDIRGNVGATIDHGKRRNSQLWYPATYSRIETRKGRSRVTNGSKLFPLSDGRSATARRFRDLYEDIAMDLGGLDLLSEGQKQLIRRAAMLSAECERMEAMAARDDRRPDGAIAWKSEVPFVFDLEIYGTLCDRLGRLFGRLGLERKSRDVTPSLQSYLQAKAAP